MSIASATQQEIQEFIFEAWQPNQRWACLAPNNAAQERLMVMMAQQYFWEEARAAIQQQLAEYAHKGWTPTETVTSSAIELDYSESVDTEIGIDQMLLWTITLGLGYLVQRQLGKLERHYRHYTPKVMRVRLQR